MSTIEWKPGLAYIASPYSHPDEDERARRWERVVHAVAVLTLMGHHVYSPIGHWHPVAISHDLPKGWDFWGALDEVMIKRCDRIWIFMDEGWDKSVGIFEELKLAKEHLIEIAGFRLEVLNGQTVVNFGGPTFELTNWLNSREDW